MGGVPVEVVYLMGIKAIFTLLKTGILCAIELCLMDYLVNSTEKQNPEGIRNMKQKDECRCLEVGGRIYKHQST